MASKDAAFAPLVTALDALLAMVCELASLPASVMVPSSSERTKAVIAPFSVVLARVGAAVAPGPSTLPWLLWITKSAVEVL